MTELKETGYKLETGDLGSTKEILNKIQTAFVSDDYFLLETPREYLSGKVSELTEDKLNKLISVKVFSDKAEFCAERKDISFSYRSITEDETSLKEKISLIKKYKLGGVASWQKGMETDNFWEFLKNEIQD